MDVVKWLKRIQKKTMEKLWTFPIVFGLLSQGLEDNCSRFRFLSLGLRTSNRLHLAKHMPTLNNSDMNSKWPYKGCGRPSKEGQVELESSSPLVPQVLIVMVMWARSSRLPSTNLRQVPLCALNLVHLQPPTTNHITNQAHSAVCEKLKFKANPKKTMQWAIANKNSKVWLVPLKNLQGPQSWPKWPVIKQNHNIRHKGKAHLEPWLVLLVAWMQAWPPMFPNQ